MNGGLPDTLEGLPAPVLRPAQLDDAVSLLSLAGAASAANDAFVFGEPAEAREFAADQWRAGVAEFAPPHSTLACDAEGCILGVVTVLTAADLLKVRLRAARWLVQSGLAGSAPDLVRRIQLAGASTLRTEPGDAYLSRIAVRPGTSGRGVGQALLKHALAFAGRVGAKRLVLDVAADNERARAFYKRAGFTEIGRLAVQDPATGRRLEHVHLAHALAASQRALASDFGSHAD